MIDDEVLAKHVREEGLATEEELEEAVILRNEEDRPLYDVLLDHDFVEEGALVEFASEVLSVPVVDPEEHESTPEAIEKIPRDVAFDKWMLPLEIEEVDGRDQLVLAMRNPIDLAAMDEVTERIEADIRPMLAEPTAVKEGLRRVYGPEHEGYDLSSADFESSRSLGEHSVHEVETIQSQDDDLQEQIAEIDKPPPFSDGRNGEDESWQSDDREGAADLVERIVEARPDISEKQRDELLAHSKGEILAAGIVSLVESGVISIDELISALPSQ